MYVLRKPNSRSALEHTRSNTGTNGRSNKLLVWINSRVTIRRKDISTRSGIWMKSLRSLERRNQQEVILFECIKREWLRTFLYWVRLNFNSITCIDHSRISTHNHRCDLPASDTQRRSLCGDDRRYRGEIKGSLGRDNAISCGVRSVLEVKSLKAQ